MANEKIISKKDLRTKLHAIVKGRDDFFTDEARAAIINECGNIRVNNNRIGQMLRGNNSHEYKKDLKKWVRIRK